MHDASSRALSISEKVAKLSAFIASDIETRTARGLLAAGGCYLLIARSPESPVALALRDHAAVLPRTGIRIRSVFSEVEPGLGAAVLAAAPFALPSECRIARDPRLLAAHEQLVLSPDRTWIGDCMRREPTKRDAYERFASSCVETAALASRSFERMWRAALPVRTFPALPAEFASRLPDVTGARPESPRRQ
jgi:hypothetical protein